MRSTWSEVCEGEVMSQDIELHEYLNKLADQVFITRKAATGPRQACEHSLIADYYTDKFYECDSCLRARCIANIDEVKNK